MVIPFFLPLCFNKGRKELYKRIKGKRKTRDNNVIMTRTRIGPLRGSADLLGKPLILHLFWAL